MHGCTSIEISETLGMHLMAAERVVQEAKAHREAFKNAVAK
jgi:hypothetical protein